MSGIITLLVKNLSVNPNIPSGPPMSGIITLLVENLSVNPNIPQDPP